MDNPRKRIWHLQSSNTRAVPSDTRAVSSDPRAVFSDTRTVFSDTSAVLSDTRAVSFNTRAVPSDTRAVFSNTSAVFFDTRAVSSDTRAVLSTRELCPRTRGLCPPTPKLCPTTREMCPLTRDFAYRHESCQAGHVAIGNTTIVSTTCTRNWGKRQKHDLHLGNVHDVHNQDVGHIEKGAAPTRSSIEAPQGQSVDHMVTAVDEVTDKWARVLKPPSTSPWSPSRCCAYSNARA